MSQETDLLMDRKPEAPAPRRDPLLTVMAGLLSMLLWLTAVSLYVFIIVRLERLFDGFKMKLPWLTELVIHESRWALPAITIAAFVVCIALGKRSRWAWPFVLIFLPLIINVVVGVSLGLAYMELPDGLSGGGKK
jgi:ABC-type polysaccharide/polyol phosphate export permease